MLIVGARDDGSPSGIAITDQLLLTLADLRSDGKTVPPPSLFVEKRMLRGAAMAVVTVLPADAPPARYEGRIWVRVGPRRGLVSAQDERIPALKSPTQVGRMAASRRPTSASLVWLTTAIRVWPR